MRVPGLREVKAQSVMNSDVPTVAPETSVPGIVQRLLDSGSSCVVVVDDGRVPVGIVTERDLLPLAAKEGYLSGAAIRQILQDETHLLDFLGEVRKSRSVRAAELMSAPVQCVDVDTNLPTVATTMETYGYRQLPVTRDGRLVGLITRRHIVRAVGEFAV